MSSRESMDPFMIIWAFIIGIFVGVIGALMLLYRTAINPLHKKIETLSNTPDEKMMEYYPYHRHNFRFLGTPISGIQFEDDCILFINFLEGKSRRTVEQKTIKQLVDAKKVSWVEFKTS